MEKLIIRRALSTDLEALEGIYAEARRFMKATGNPDQWGDSYPSRSLILSDIEKGELYVIAGAFIEAVFVFTKGKDPTYDRIEGKWLSDGPYRAVHRVASANRTKGVIRTVMDYCFSYCDSIRIDTHELNTVMQGALEKYGFIFCGTVYLEDGTKRLAYQMNK